MFLLAGCFWLLNFQVRKVYRGNDIYDPVNVGFVSTQAEDAAGRKFFEFNTRLAGNGNQGHEGEAFGTELPEDKKAALLEYLKTF